MIKIAVVIGTRPEAIKMAPVILELKKFPRLFELIVITSGQHKEMFDNPMSDFKISPDYDLKIMHLKQSLIDINKRILSKLGQILKKEKPDLVLIHGDTPTAFSGALAAFYSKVLVGHVEAGLRTYEKYNPFPEEMNRRLIDVLTDLFFAPTKEVLSNLLKEGKNRKNIWVTGNTVIDAVRIIKNTHKAFSSPHLSKIDFKNKKVILFTCHRREVWGAKMEEIFRGLKSCVAQLKEVEVIYPIHPNKIIKRPARKILGDNPRIHLIEPLSYPDVIKVLDKSYLVLTDSGGLQEEACFLHKPVLVLREVTERVEGVKSGGIKLVGVDKESIYKGVAQIILDKKIYKKMSLAKNPYGSGYSSKKIKGALVSYFGLK